MVESSEFIAFRNMVKDILPPLTQISCKVKQKILLIADAAVIREVVVHQQVRPNYHFLQIAHLHFFPPSLTAT